LIAPQPCATSKPQPFNAPQPCATSKPQPFNALPRATPPSRSRGFFYAITPEKYTMAQSIQALREQIAARAKEVRALVENKNAAWSAESQEKYDAGLKEIESLKAQVDRLQAILDLGDDDETAEALAQAAARHARNSGAKGGPDKIHALFANWIRGGREALSAEDWQSIRNTMSTTTPSEGGYTVATEVAKTVADALKSLGGMRQVATVIQSAGGQTINYPTSDGTSEEGAQIGQNTTAGKADISFGVIAHEIFKYTSKVVTLPVELIQDTSVDILGIVTTRSTQRVGRITNKKFTIGSGSGEPKGAVTAAAAGKVGTTGQTATVIVDDLVDLEHSVDIAYRELGRCRWMMHDSTFKVIKKLKDSTGRPIFMPGYDGLGGKMPDTILGYPVTINNHMATMAANAKSILFGDFSYYVIRDVTGATEFQRYTDSAYAELGQVGFNLWTRSGGTYTDVGGALKYYQNSAS
jgi:HK97 family phage major capsid protein